MERSHYWKLGFTALVALAAVYFLIPTWYYFQLPPDERNEPEKLAAVLPSWAPSETTRLNLGLDLQGGIHLVLGVDVEAALRAKIARRGDQIALWAKDEGFEVTTEVKNNRVIVTAADEAAAEQLEPKATQYFQDMYIVDDGQGYFTLAYQDQFLRELRTDSVDQALKVISNRVDRWGVAEPIIAKRGDNNILVQLPGFKDPERAKELLGKTAQLEFRIVDDTSTFFRDLQNLPEGVTLSSDGASPYLVATGANGRETLEQFLEGKIPAGREVGYECIPDPVRKNTCTGYRTYLLNEKIELTGESIVDARALLDQSAGAGGKPYVALTFDAQGARDFERITGENVMKRMAIVLDGTVNSAPVIQQRIAGGNASITMGGLKSFEELVTEANDLALVLKAGALPAPVTIGEERTVGASLGPELVRNGTYATVLGLALVLIFMVVYYKVSGLVADVALALNGLLMLAVMAMFNSTLTLPGIAGFVLSLGMAIDANVLINERIREELRAGKTARAAMEGGYARAFSSIFDGHVTTLIAGFVLLQYGSGPVRGFAVMLIIGLLASLFTAVFVTRAIMDWLVIGRGLKRISV